MELKAIRFPEWKQLYDEIIGLIDQGQRQFSYEELNKMGAIDTRTGRGRAQFYRFRRELLKTRQLWLENISNYGYGIIESRDHPNAAYRRVNQARRRINTAKAINSNIRIEDLTSEQRLLQAGMAAILHELSKTFHAAGHRFAIASKDPSKLAINLEELTKSIEPKTKRIAPT
jgi:DNA-binding transcriptional MocR family regulator